MRNLLHLSKSNGTALLINVLRAVFLFFISILFFYLIVMML